MTKKWQPLASKEMIHARASLLGNIRDFFAIRGVVEVETPLLSSACVTDPNLDSIETQFRGESYYLNTSPEFCMKRLLAQYREPIYQICKSFRDDELGPNHNPEFTMLEWYRPQFSMSELMDELEALLKDLHEDCDKPVQRVSYRQAFENSIGLDPHTASVAECYECALQNKIEVPAGMDGNDKQLKDAWLDWLLTQSVLPGFESDYYTFIYDYPESQSALARLEKDETGIVVARRFELFYGEMELANGFYELLDAREQKNRFEKENLLRIANNKKPVQIDLHLLDALEHGLPECSGVAVGLDRLLMVLCQKGAIEEVLTFPWQRV